MGTNLAARSASIASNAISQLPTPVIVQAGETTNKASETYEQFNPRGIDVTFEMEHQEIAYKNGLPVLAKGATVKTFEVGHTDIELASNAITLEDTNLVFATKRFGNMRVLLGFNFTASVWVTPTQKRQLLSTALKDDPNLLITKSNEDPLLDIAAAYGDRDFAEVLLANKVDINVKDNKGLTPLHWAAAQGHNDVVALLLANKADVNIKASNGYTPLHGAALAGHVEVVKLLLANNADPNARADDGGTALHLAASRGHLEIVELLLAGKADINAKAQNGYTPLKAAIFFGQKSVEETLRRHGGTE